MSLQMLEGFLRHLRVNFMDQRWNILRILLNLVWIVLIQLIFHTANTSFVVKVLLEGSRQQQWLNGLIRLLNLYFLGFAFDCFCVAVTLVGLLEFFKKLNYQLVGDVEQVFRLAEYPAIQTLVFF